MGPPQNVCVEGDIFCDFGAHAKLFEGYFTDMCANAHVNGGRATQSSVHRRGQQGPSSV